MNAHYPTSGVGEISSYAAFEAPDPMYWVPRGYAIITVNIRGTWYSEGNATFVSSKEAEDFYDLIEWAGQQPWSNGRVGLSGVSYLSVMQWRVAELNPPHLAAINPWEGWTDTYREIVKHGGIPETFFWPRIQQRWGTSTTRIEDLATATEEHPFYDEYWESKASDLSKITVPAYVVASWSDQGMHTRGTLEGYKRINSQQKWLEIHGRKKWAHYYDPDSVQRQQEFFDYFLQGKSTSITSWPKVRLEVREKYYLGSIRSENEWPLARTNYTKFYLNTAIGTLQREPVQQEASCSYESLGETNNFSDFSITFNEPTEIIGHMKLKLFMKPEGSDDMDVIVAIQKFNSAGELVPFPYYNACENGPVAMGWLRASHRELDEELSTEFQPILAHRRELKINDQEIVPLDVEIWPSGTRFEIGETLKVIVRGTDMNNYSEDTVIARHKDTVNKGRHIIYSGGKYDSHLLVPIIPE